MKHCTQVMKGDIANTVNYREFIDVLTADFSKMLLPPEITELIENVKEQLLLSLGPSNGEFASTGELVNLPYDVPYSVFRFLIESDKLPVPSENTSKCASENWRLFS